MNAISTDLMKDHASPAQRPPKPGPLLRLVAWSSAVALCWLVVLPWLGSRPAVSNHLEWLEEQGVDPSAMYYTDLEVMKPIRERLNVGLGIGGAERTNAPQSTTNSAPSPSFPKTEH